MEKLCCNWGVSQHLTPERQRDVKVRLQKIKGQVQGVTKMIDEDRACVDILTQIASVSSALRSVRQIILRNYLETCVKTAILEGKTEIYDEVVRIFDTFAK